VIESEPAKDPGTISGLMLARGGGVLLRDLAATDPTQEPRPRRSPLRLPLDSRHARADEVQRVLRAGTAR